MSKIRLSILKGDCMPSNKVSIITRAYNRLDYTIKCINLVKQNTIYSNYEHLIIDNASSDGTAQWLKWIKARPNNWFDKVRPVYQDKNHGDWGGMVEGAKHIADDSEYIVQLDNDIEVPYEWLTGLIDALTVSGQKVTMLKRTGVQQTLIPKNIRVYAPFDGGDVDICVACFAVKTIDFKSVMNKVKRCGEIPKALNSKCFKITSLTCHQMEGWNGETYIQHNKYGKG